MRRIARTAMIGGLLVLGLGVLAAGHTSLTEISPPRVPASTLPAPSEPSAQGAATELTNQLLQLPAGPIAPPAPYDRAEFGQRWADVDRSGCDQRNESLSSAMTEISYRAGTHDCVVETGTFHDAYDGTSWSFAKSEDGGGVQIDHVVPLAHAWEMGAGDWTEDEREVFANELINLQPTAGTYNGSKGSRGPLEWMPVDETYHCTYLRRWTQIKVTWELAVTDDERTFLSDSLMVCGG